MEKARLSNRYCPDGMTVEEWQVALRHEYAEENEFTVEHTDDNRIWGDYLVSNNGGNRYKVAFRGVRSERNYCSCLDFRTNGLGTCKHIEAVSLYLQHQEPGFPWNNNDYITPYSSIYVSYKGGRTVRLSIGSEKQQEYEVLRRKFFDDKCVLYKEHYNQIEQIYAEGLAISETFRCYDDVWALINKQLETIEWQDGLQHHFSEQLFQSPIIATEQSNASRAEIYKYLHRGYGIIVSKVNQQFRREIVAMIDYIANEEQLPAIIIANDNISADIWRMLIESLPTESGRLQIVTADSFSSKDRFFAEIYSCIFVENSDKLKEWTHPLSILLKKLEVKHLYMHLYTINSLTPIQFSSITQHISPYIIGPFYRFIRDYRPIFPLQDGGENFPLIVSDFVFTRKPNKNQIWNEQKAATSLLEENGVANQLIENFLQSAVQLLADESACKMLKETLLKVLKKDNDRP